MSSQGNNVSECVMTLITHEVSMQNKERYTYMKRLLSTANVTTIHLQSDQIASSVQVITLW